ncbi:glutamate-5-semialdehyde dehydrogenase [Chryseolinea sp. T2]|uniref:glutamate-5-semialdehyde dehydrogenase n=1 Tax=Chryseolinea sp. T2 TaxID=3129255 RepID=UPI00307844E1
MTATQTWIDEFNRAREASRTLGLLAPARVTAVLNAVADSAERNAEGILKANAEDLSRMDPNDPRYDRLKLTLERIHSITGEIRQVAKLPSPLGKTIETRLLPNGLHLEKVTVPLGVIGVIYEARPNVTFDVFSLCLRSGNACVLKGGSDAAQSNSFIAKLIENVLIGEGLPKGAITLLPPDRAATQALLEAIGYVDVLIPRGSQQLIDYVRQNAKIPVIETGAGIVHTYFDVSGDLQKGANIVFNSKTRRVSVCNALDCLIIHQQRLNDLPSLTLKLAEKNVTIYADELSFEVLRDHYPTRLLEHASEEHFGTEFLDYKMSIRTVGSLNEALDHIYRHSSKHSEAIVAEDPGHVDTFLRSVDAAVVYANASTAFTDGAQFGMGAEIGISTQKLHARGPMALPELTSYKWIVRGQGNVRNP